METKNQTSIAKDSANDKTFPQFQLSEEVGAVAHSEDSLLCGPDFGGGTKDGMEHFRRDEAVQNRFAGVVGVEKNTARCCDRGCDISKKKPSELDT